MVYELPPLPYDASALEPHISTQTMMHHYGKHHQGYVDKLNGAIEESDLENADLASIVCKAANDDDQYLFNNAAQVWNHNFFWESMMPSSGKPPKELQAAIEEAFHGLGGFRDAFKKAATSQFGSGWAWLVLNNSKLEILTTANAHTPIVDGLQPLLCCDVWEHAYYLDYKNERGHFVETFLEHLINWEFALANFEKEMASARAAKG